MARKRKQTGKIDEEIEESFPASDPPAFMPGALGAPKRRNSTAKPAKKAKTAKRTKAVTKSRPKKAKKKSATKRRKAR
jgi:hypothetical protein